MKLSDDEATGIDKYLTRLGTVQSQIRNLMAQGEEIKDVINTFWRDAHRGKQLEDKEFAERLGDDTVPPMINVMGQQVVSFNPKTRTATWDTVHDTKRVAKNHTADDEIKSDDSDHIEAVEESEVPNDDESVKEEVRDETG